MASSSTILPLHNLLACCSMPCASTISTPSHFSSPSLFPSCCSTWSARLPLSPPFSPDSRASGRLLLLLAHALVQGEPEQLDDSPPPPPLPNNLPMHFKAEGTLSELAIPRVVKALEAIEGVSDVSVTILEGIATVELLRLTNIQATGASSSLIEIIQSQGFKLQNLSIVFDDDGEDDAYDYDYATSE